LFNNTEKSELYILQYFRPINMTINMLFDNILNIKLPVYKFIFIKLKFLKTCQSSCHIELLCGEIYHCLANDTCVTMEMTVIYNVVHVTCSYIHCAFSVHLSSVDRMRFKRESAYKMEYTEVSAKQ
jgi:hypothetical protein